jgi:hypothetical protein
MSVPGTAIRTTVPSIGMPNAQYNCTLPHPRRSRLAISMQYSNLIGHYITENDLADARLALVGLEDGED